MSLVEVGPIELVIFDGDLTLYDDGESLKPDNPAIPRILRLLKKGVYIGIVTAAGYTESSKYYGRLYGLLDAVQASSDLSPAQKKNLVVVGGESNFLYRCDPTINSTKPISRPNDPSTNDKSLNQGNSSSGAGDVLRFIPREEWALDEMKAWSEADILELLDVAQGALQDCIDNMHLPADLIRKDRAVGISPRSGYKLVREQLEETVMVAQRKLELSSVGRKIPFCAFNGSTTPTSAAPPRPPHSFISGSLPLFLSYIISDSLFLIPYRFMCSLLASVSFILHLYLTSHDL